MECQGGLGYLLRVGCFLWVAWVGGCASPEPPSTPEKEPSAAPFRIFDLTRIVEEEEIPQGPMFELVIWELEGSSRPSLRQRPSHPVALGPIPGGSDCEFRFDLGAHAGQWQDTDGIEFKASVRQGERERLFFSELFEPREQSTNRWHPRQAPVPPLEAEPFFLVLETGPGPAGDVRADNAAWGSPHLVCKTPVMVENESGQPHVILLSIDTLRQDHLGLYGYDRETSPHLDLLGDESLVFDNAFSTASFTLPAHGSMFTGLPPEVHRAGHDHLKTPLPAEAHTLAERLAAAGYRTVAFTAGGVMDRASGLDQGFEQWTERRAANLDAMMPSYLDSLGRFDGRPLFFFLHTYDVHAPYLPREEHFSLASGSEQATTDDWKKIRGSHYHRHHRFERFENLEQVVAAYDSGIRDADAQIALLLDYLRQIDAFDDALVIVTSDHGEAFFERGHYVGHSHTLYDEEIRVPLVVKLPNSARRGRIEGFVSLMDLVPMILQFAGLDLGDLPEARSLLHELPEEGSEGTRDAVWGETSITGSRFVRTRDWKVISPHRPYWDERAAEVFTPTRDRFLTGWQIYDLRTDPAERRNLFEASAEVPVEVRRLVRDLRRGKPPGDDMMDGGPRLDPEEEAALRALGYVD